jgi:hypothetical protein
MESPEGEACNPCIQVCPCTPGFTFYDPGTCTTYTCVDGSWGGMGCIGLGCDDAGEADARLDSAAWTDASPSEAGDSSSDAGDGATADAMQAADGAAE